MDEQIPWNSTVQIRANKIVAHSLLYEVKFLFVGGTRDLDSPLSKFFILLARFRMQIAYAM